MPDFTPQAPDFTPARPPVRVRRYTADMTEVVSVSLGSSTRDMNHQFELLGTTVNISRRGMNADLGAAERLIGELDGQVAAFGLGGIDLYFLLRDRRYYFKDAVRLAKAARLTPLVCGAGLKNSLERLAVADLDATLSWKGRRVLMVSGADRFGMADALVSHGAEVVCGDLMFALGLDMPLKSLPALERAARILLPVLSRVPFRWLYPQGSSQDQAPKLGRFDKYYDWAEVIAGDWHFIRKHAPASLAGKTIFTNTTTATDVEILKARGAKTLITTTPRFGSRSIGTNLLEAAFVAVEGARGELGKERYDELIVSAGLKPTVTAL